jgi:hypothetical protein
MNSDHTCGKPSGRPTAATPATSDCRTSIIGEVGAGEEGWLLAAPSAWSGSLSV